MTRVAAGLLSLPGCPNVGHLVGYRAGSRDRSGLVEYPGGKLEPGETWEEALRREWGEEIHGVAVTAGRLLATYEHPETPDCYAFELRLFEAVPDAGWDGRARAGDSHSGLAWMPPEEVLRLSRLGLTTPSMGPLAEALLRLRLLR